MSENRTTRQSARLNNIIIQNGSYSRDIVMKSDTLTTYSCSNTSLSLCIVYIHMYSRKKKSMTGFIRVNWNQTIKIWMSTIIKMNDPIYACKGMVIYMSVTWMIAGTNVNEWCFTLRYINYEMSGTYFIFVKFI